MVATVIMVATMVTTTGGLTSIFSATATDEAGTPSIIAIEELRVAGLGTQVVAVSADTVAVAATAVAVTAVAVTAAAGEGINLRNS
jgi:hypothetical protein